MENNTLHFIQLVKSILEYYGTTKNTKSKDVFEEFSDELEQAESIIDNFDKFENFDMDSIFVEIPEDIDNEIKKTFLSQLRLYQIQKANNENSSPKKKGGQLNG